MLESITWQKNSKFRKIKYAWPVCTRLLQTIKRHHEEMKNCKHVIRKLNRTGKVRIKRLMEDTKKLNAQRVSYNRYATVTPHQFYTSHADWAVEIGLNKEAADTWSNCNKYTQDASINQSKNTAMDHPQLAIGMTEWTTSNNGEKSELIHSRIDMTQKAKRTLVKIYCRNNDIVRRRPLITNDMATWAKYIRPNFRCSHG